MHLHPPIVHFPIALLIVSGLCWCIYLLWNQPVFREVGFWNHLFGLVGVALAIISGTIEETYVEVGPSIKEQLETHETLGYVMGWYYALMLLWVYFRKAMMYAWEEKLFTVLFMLGLALVVWTGHVGGIMVYEEGLGVNTSLFDWLNW